MYTYPKKLTATNSAAKVQTAISRSLFGGSPGLDPSRAEFEEAANAPNTPSMGMIGGLYVEDPLVKYGLK